MVESEKCQIVAAFGQQTILQAFNMHTETHCDINYLTTFEFFTDVWQWLLQIGSWDQNGAVIDLVDQDVSIEPLGCMGFGKLKPPQEDWSAVDDAELFTM